ncbi:MAG: peptidoglycan DD-metalloendopeptidase family protein [Candidatus Binatia bacterium]
MTVIRRRATPGYGFPGFANRLGLFIVLLATVALTPVDASATKQKGLRKEPAKGKSATVAAPMQRFSKGQTRNALLRQPSPQPIDPLEKREQIVYRVRSRDTLTEVLGRYGVPQADRQLWVRTMKRNFGAEVLPAGKELHLYFAKPTFRSQSQKLGQLKALEIDLDPSHNLTLERGIRGILFQKREKPFDVEVKSISGSVVNTLFDDGRKAGVHPALLSQLTDIFTWDIDLEKDIRPGDSFKILYEQRSRKGQETHSSLRILAAELLNSGQKHTAIYFEKQKGHGNYYNVDGRSLARSFLRFPLEFTSITSLFTESRFHPILKTNLPHTGIDFAAQRGTPVRAVGDGIIAEAGWNGGYGKSIDIKHDGTYLSRYAHLGSFAEGIRSGVVVTRGQVIGFVGSTGRSTGPHLHFEFYKDQLYVNPLSVDVPADEQIEPALLRTFETQKRTFLVELAATPQS